MAREWTRRSIEEIMKGVIIKKGAKPDDGGDSGHLDKNDARFYPGPLAALHGLKVTPMKLYLKYYGYAFHYAQFNYIGKYQAETGFDPIPHDIWKFSFKKGWAFNYDRSDGWLALWLVPTVNRDYGSAFYYTDADEAKPPYLANDIIWNIWSWKDVTPFYDPNISSGSMESLTIEGSGGYGPVTFSGADAKRILTATGHFKYADFSNTIDLREYISGNDYNEWGLFGDAEVDGDNFRVGLQGQEFGTLIAYVDVKDGRVLYMNVDGTETGNINQYIWTPS